MSQTATILVIDDEPQIRKFLRISLVSQGYKVLEAASGAEGLTQAALNKPDLLVLDLGLPDMDGQQVLSEFREWSAVPVLVLSVRASEVQKVQALDAGANDYVTKPFGIQEFLARVRALLRQVSGSDKPESALRFGPLTVDLAYRRVLLDDQEVALTRKEYSVLAQLARHLDGSSLSSNCSRIYGARRIPKTAIICALWLGICARNWAMIRPRRGSSSPRPGSAIDCLLTADGLNMKTTIAASGPRHFCCAGPSKPHTPH